MQRLGQSLDHVAGFIKLAALDWRVAAEGATDDFAQRLGTVDDERIRSHFPEEHIADGRPGRKPIPTRRVLEAVLWLLNTGAQWHMLPQSYPNYKTVHRRFQAWCRDEILRRLLTDVANELRDRGALDEEECFIDVAVLERLFSPLADMKEYKAALRALTQASDAVLFRIVEDTARAFADDAPNPWTKALLDQECQQFLNCLLELRDGFMLRHQDELLRALGKQRVPDASLRVA
jgi:hypothetical protein